VNRSEMKARSELFDRFALKDQKNYYTQTVRNYRRAASQVNLYRALFAFLTGVAAAAAGLLVATTGGVCRADAAPNYCAAADFVIGFLAIAAIVLPAFGAAFSTLADLYQWDKLTNVYKAALDNLEEADALSPLEVMDDLTYRASMRAFAQSTLTIMNEESSQWGQTIRTPAQLQEFIEQEKRKAEQES
jgi:hypothetical protein